MWLSTADGRQLRRPTSADLTAVLDTTGPGGNPVVRLARAADDWIRADLDASGHYAVEWRDGSPHRHYRVDFPCDHEEVAEVLDSYLSGDNRWRTRLEWRRDRRVIP